MTVTLAHDAHRRLMMHKGLLLLKLLFICRRRKNKSANSLHCGFTCSISGQFFALHPSQFAHSLYARERCNTPHLDEALQKYTQRYLPSTGCPLVIILRQLSQRSRGSSMLLSHCSPWLHSAASPLHPAPLPF